MAQHTERGDAMSKQWQYRPGFGWVERDATADVTEGQRPECRYYGSTFGPCAGPSNGRECWQHSQIARVAS
jgi:hypothetical protein